MRNHYYQFHLAYFFLLRFSGWKIDTFEQTVQMSTYLVAFVVSNFEKITKNSTKSIEVSVLARKDAIDAKDGDFALDESIKNLDFFADYFNISYPLQKSSKKNMICKKLALQVILIFFLFFQLN